MMAGGTVFSRRLSAIHPPTWTTLTPPFTWVQKIPAKNAAWASIWAIIGNDMAGFILVPRLGLSRLQLASSPPLVHRRCRRCSGQMGRRPWRSPSQYRRLLRRFWAQVRQRKGGSGSMIRMQRSVLGKGIRRPMPAVNGERLPRCVLVCCRWSGGSAPSPVLPLSMSYPVLLDGGGPMP